MAALTHWVTQEDMKAAGALAQFVEILDLRLVKVEAEGNLTDLSPSKLLHYQVKHGVESANISQTTPQKLRVVLWMSVECGTEPISTKPDAQAEQRAPSGVFGVRVSICAEYEVRAFPEGVAPPPQGVLDVFASVNGTYNCWPYFRQAVHSLSSMMGVPLVVPTLRIKTKAPDHMSAPTPESNGSASVQAESAGQGSADPADPDPPRPGRKPRTKSSQTGKAKKEK